MNKLYASTGTFIGRANRFDFGVIAEKAAEIECDGFELMMLPAWSDKLPAIARFLKSSRIYTPVLHFDKEIGNLLSLGETGEAMRIFAANCAFACAVGARRGVLHLWGGMPSDGNFAVNASVLPFVYSKAAEYGVEIMVENVPCRFAAPLERLREIKRGFPGATFVLDTRFASFCGEIEDFCAAADMWDGSVSHIHISDYNGGGANKGLIRPILHPGEGVIDFDAFFRGLPRFGGTVTLESPVLSESGEIDVKKLNATLSYLRRKLNETEPKGRTK